MLSPADERFGATSRGNGVGTTRVAYGSDDYVVIGGITIGGPYWLADPRFSVGAEHAAGLVSKVDLYSNATAQPVRQYSALRAILSDSAGDAPMTESGQLDEIASASQARSPMVPRVRSAFSAWGDLLAGTEDARMAEAARDDAITLLDRDRLPGGAVVEINDDGILSIEWEREGCGVLLVFSGDNTAGYSRRDALGFYSSCLTEFVIGDGLPPNARAAIERLVG